MRETDKRERERGERDRKQRKRGTVRKMKDANKGEGATREKE